MKGPKRQNAEIGTASTKSSRDGTPTTGEAHLSSASGPDSSRESDPAGEISSRHGGHADTATTEAQLGKNSLDHFDA